MQPQLARLSHVASAPCSRPVLMSLKECLAKAQADAAVKAIVVTGAQGKFSAGFDITHLAKLQATGSQEDFGTDVNAFLIKLLEAGPKPSVAGALAKRGAWSLRPHDC